MRTFFKFTFIVIGLIIIGLLALPFVINPNDYKSQIAAQVEKATGRTLTIDGDIGLSVFPWVALKLGPVSLSNAKGFKGDYFAKVNKAEIRIKLLPLLNKKLEMDTIVLDGLNLNLQKNKSGQANWSDLAGQNSESAPAQKSSTTSDSDNTPALAAITIAGIKLNNAHIQWADASAGQNIQIDNLSLTTDPLIPGKPTQVKLDTDVISQTPNAKAHLTLATQLTVDMDSQRYAMTNTILTTQIAGKELAVDTADIALNGDITADLKQQLITLNALLVNISANKGKQRLKTRLAADVDANLATQQSQITGLDLSIDIADPALPQGTLRAKLKSDIQANLKKQTVTLSNLALAIKDLLIEGNMTAYRVLSDNPGAKGHIQIAPFNLRQLAQSMAIELPVMADDSTLTHLTLKSDIEASAKQFKVQSLNLTLDQSHLTGQLAIVNFSHPAYRFKLVLDEIDADRYLPPASKEEKTAPPASAAAAGASQLPLQTLRDLNAIGTLDIGKLKINGLRSEKIHLSIDAQKGLIKLAPLSAKLYQGSYNGHVQLNAQGKVLKIALNEKLAGVQAEPLLKDLTGEAKISGIMHASAVLTGQGKTVEHIKQTLTGHGQFAFKDGAIKGINIAESIRKAKAVLQGKPYDSVAPRQTDFASLTGSFTAKNGLITNPDLALLSPLLRVAGQGTANLATETINYALKVAIVGSLKGEGSKQLADLKGLTIPIKISGTFSQPKPSVDLASLLKDKAKAKVKAKIKAKLKDKLGGPLGGLIDGALGTDTASPPEQASPAQPSAPEKPAQNKTQPPPASLEDKAKDALKNKLKSLF